MKKDVLKLLHRVEIIEKIKNNFLNEMNFARYEASCQVQAKLIERAKKMLIVIVRLDPVKNSENSDLKEITEKLYRIKCLSEIGEAVLEIMRGVANVYQEGFYPTTYNKIGKKEELVQRQALNLMG